MAQYVLFRSPHLGKRIEGIAYCSSQFGGHCIYFTSVVRHCISFTSVWKGLHLFHLSLESIASISPQLGKNCIYFTSVGKALYLFYPLHLSFEGITSVPHQGQIFVCGGEVDSKILANGEVYDPQVNGCLGMILTS